MSIVHHDNVLQHTVDILSNELVNEPEAAAYIIQNVYGKIIVYVDSSKELLISHIKEILTQKIDLWLNTCEVYGENFFAKSEIELWKKKIPPIQSRVWVFERFLTNAYWDGHKKYSHSKNIQSKLISFYSFKGGVGRTTTLMMIAIELAKQGKKIAIVDFDLEAPGISSLFPQEALSSYGLLDFLLETNVYDVKIDEYIYPVSEYCHVDKIGGITLTRYSDMALLFFYGSQQHVDDMKMVLPILKKSNTPFLMINSKVPANEDVAQIEKHLYLEGAYDALRLCDERYKNWEIMIDDDTSEHYPIDIAYNTGLEVINSTEQLLRSFEEQRADYRSISNTITESMFSEPAELDAALRDSSLQKQLIESFSDIMNGLETAAAEDEFATEQDLIKNFYPLRAYTFIFDPRKFLVLGQKGVGKTALFSALKTNNYAKALARYLNVNINQYEHTEWVVGTSRETNYIDIFACLIDEEQIRAFLYYKTVEILMKHDPSLKPLIMGSNAGILFGESFQTENCKLLTGEMACFLNELLKKIDQRYLRQNIVITIIYDALDRIVSAKDRTRFVSALINMWYINESIMQNIRSKIFLRKDIYDREVIAADKVKLKNYSATIGWDYDQLFAIVWKRAPVQRSPVEEKVLSLALSAAGFENPREEILNLINIGILKQYQIKLSDPVRYHFPDIYLRGLGLRRSGMK